MRVMIKVSSIASASPAPAKLGPVPSGEGDGSAVPQAPTWVPAWSLSSAQESLPGAL